MAAPAWAGRLGLLVALLAATAALLIKWTSVGNNNNNSTTINYVSKDFFHEGADWDAENSRVLLSILRLSGGGLVEVVPCTPSCTVSSPLVVSFRRMNSLSVINVSEEWTRSL